jgi:hypothetical protein
MKLYKVIIRTIQSEVRKYSIIEIWMVHTLNKTKSEFHGLSARTYLQKIQYFKHCHIFCLYYSFKCKKTIQTSEHCIKRYIEKKYKVQ